ncbi:hypothetical protein SKAU_G00165790 [Synaphobranchus kaupii]|uniref:Uncharacterized protein n=1 Tax=Synaphobranchus kaupii TaxID=118154 RepID=A0A9Q1FJV6_SYNKA|nr:hypothetical protein SKAU_G00165790 [Synaphobranchus kaupii]
MVVTEVLPHLEAIYILPRLPTGIQKAPDPIGDRHSRHHAVPPIRAAASKPGHLELLQSTQFTTALWYMKHATAPHTAVASGERPLKYKWASGMNRAVLPSYWASRSYSLISGTFCSRQTHRHMRGGRSVGIIPNWNNPGSHPYGEEAGGDHRGPITHEL